MFQYQYPRPAVAVDCVVFGYRNFGIGSAGGSEPDFGDVDTDQGSVIQGPELRVLLIKRRNDPFAGSWAFPGGFLDMDETLDQAASRELMEETGLECQYLEQLFTFGKVDRDPRERVLSVGYYALVRSDFSDVTAASDAKEAEWFSLERLPALAFDHQEIFRTAIQRLRGKIRYEPVGFNLLPEKFTLPQLQHLYESILGRPLDKRNFRKKVLGLDLLIDCQQKQMGTGRRPPSLYQFDSKKYQSKKADGFLFEL